MSVMAVQLLFALCFTGFLAKCKTSKDCNSLGDCIRGRCVCFLGVLGENCQGKNSCLAERIRIFDNSLMVYCNMGGECLNQGGRVYGCVCRPGFTGEFCESFSCTADYMCSKRGSCNLDDEHILHGHCNCIPGYSGRDCHYDFCALSNVTSGVTFPCNSGGQCTIIRNDLLRLGKMYGCLCRIGFSGDTCGDYSCDSENPCSNGGTCNGNGTCTCRHGSFLGSDCGIDTCGTWLENGSQLCSGKGSCEPGSNASLPYSCRCNTGYFGYDCSENGCTSDDGCFNGGICNTDSEYGVVGACTCRSGFTGDFCNDCKYPKNIHIESPFEEASMVCVPDSCLKNGFPCNGFGLCTEDDNGVWECACRKDGLSLGRNECIPNNISLNNCAMTQQNSTTSPVACNNKGDCRPTSKGVWKCFCHRNSILAKDGNCYPKTCVQNGVVCSGMGECVENLLSGEYYCLCSGNYVGSGGLCVLKSSHVAVAVIVPLLILGGIAGFLCWWFLCHKKRGSSQGSSSSRNGRKGKGIRISDGDSFSIQSGISAYTSQL